MHLLYNYMFSVIVIIFEAIAVLFIGIFARSTDTTITTSTNGTSNSTLIGDSLTLMLAFTFMYSPFRKLSIFAFVSLLIVIAIAVQTNILFGTFWDSCFTGFSSSFQVTAVLMVRCVFASLAVLLTVLDFIGLFDYWQVYLLIAPIMTIGYSLNSAIITYGLKTYDGGGGYIIFLYSGICSLMIWVMCIRGKIDNNRYRIKQSYINHMLGFIGVIIAFFNWPKFNMAGALVTAINTTATSTSLQNSAVPNTFLGLSAALLVAILFASKETKQEKLKYKVYIDGFINSGIVIASFQDVLLNPSACLIMASISTIMTLIIHKYFLTQSDTESESVFKTMMRTYGKIIYRIIFSFLGSIVAAIVVATRTGQTPTLLSDGNYSKIGGFQIVAWIIVAIIGTVFGAITGVTINVFLNYKKTEVAEKNEQEVKVIDITDQEYFDTFMNDQIHPLYYDIFDEINKKQKEKINLADYTTKVIKESLLGAQENPLRTMSITKNADTRADPRDVRLIIQKDFSKSNFKNGDVSKMKMIQSKFDEPSQDERRQEEGVVNPNKELRVQKSKLKITENETVPQNKEENVRRKLTFSQDQEIKREDLGKSAIRH